MRGGDRIMAKRRCDICGKGDKDVGWTGAKICLHCGAFAWLG